ncbi:hypothetical protein D3C78_477780 [compost metagenome]
MQSGQRQGVAVVGDALVVEAQGEAVAGLRYAAHAELVGVGLAGGVGVGHTHGVGISVGQRRAARQGRAGVVDIGPAGRQRRRQGVGIRIGDRRCEEVQPPTKSYAQNVVSHRRRPPHQLRLTDAASAAIVGGAFRTRGAGECQLLGLEQCVADIPGAAAGRLQGEAVAGHRQCVESHLEALPFPFRIGKAQGVWAGAAHRHADRLAVAQPPRGEVGAVEIQAVIAGIQLAGIGDLQVRFHRADIAALLQHAQGRDARVVDVAEQHPAGLAGQVQALAKLAVHRIGEGQGDLPQAVVGAVQHGVAIGQQAAHLPAGNLRRDGLGDAAADQLDLVTTRVLGAGHHLQRRHFVADHQRLAGADEQAEGGVILVHHLHAHQLRELADGFVAGVQQVIRLHAGARRLEDRVVVAGNGIGQRVDLAGQGAELLIDQAVLLVQLVVQGIERLRQPLRLGQQRFAALGGGRVGGRGLQCGEELLQRRADTGGGVGKQRIELLDLSLEGIQLVALTGRRAYLGGEEVAGQPAHVGHLGAGADIAIAGELRNGGFLHCLLPRITRGVDVGDVVAGGGQRGLGGAQAG